MTAQPPGTLPGTIPELYCVDDLTVDVGAAQCRRGSETVELPRLSFDLLVCLIRRSPDVVSLETLIDEVWRGTAVGDETVVQRVALLRKALGDRSADPRYVRSVRGRGYQLIPAVLRLERSGSESPLAPRPGDAEPRRKTRRWVALPAALLLATALGAALWMPSPTTPPTAAPTTAEPSVDRLVERGMEYLARHRADDNERALELFERALAADPESVEALTGASLAHSHRVTKFNHPLTWADEAETLAQRALALDARSAEAHHALAMARDAQAEIGPALDAYRRAVELDPQHAGAWASAGYLLYVRGELAESLEWSLRSLALGADLPYGELQVAQALAALELDPAAEVWFEKTLALRPDNVFAHIDYAEFRLSRGELDHTLELVTRAEEEGIERPELLVLRSRVALLQGDRAAARGFAIEANERFPESFEATVYRQLLDPVHDHAQLLERIAQARQHGDEWPEHRLSEAMLHSAAEEHDKALATLDETITLGYRGIDRLVIDPMFEGLRRNPGFWSRIEDLRSRVAAERAKVQGAPWLPPDLLTQSPSDG